MPLRLKVVDEVVEKLLVLERSMWILFCGCVPSVAVEAVVWCGSVVVG